MLREGNLLLSDAEKEIVWYIAQNFNPADTALVQGAASGHSLALALAVAGFDTLAFEPEPPILETLLRSVDALAPLVPGLKERLRPTAGGYLDAFKVGANPPGKNSVLLAVGMDDAAMREVQLASLSVFDDAVIEFTPLEARSPDTERSLLARLGKLHDFVRRLWIRPEGEIWHVRPSRILGAIKPSASVGTVPARVGTPLEVDIAEFNGELVKMQKDWIEGEGKKYPADDAYAAKAEGKAILLKHECAIAETIALIFDAAETEITEDR